MAGFPSIQTGYYDGTTVRVSLTLLDETLNAQAVGFGASYNFSKVWGQGIVSLGYTQGTIDIKDGTITLLTGEFIQLMNKVLGTYGAHALEFDITITFDIINIPLQKITLSRCRFKEYDVQWQLAANTSALTSDITFACQDIVFNDVGGVLGKLLQSLPGALGAINDVASVF